LNISKFKTHGMGLTLCAKNLQGTIAMNYQAHCSYYGNIMNGVNNDDLSTTANADILTNYNRHVANGVPRWDRPGNTGGIWQETWATRCLDNNSVTFAGLHIIEGIYGRDGNFMDGPGENGLATDYMTNCIIFGRNQFHVDNIGHYLAGHEPGNFRKKFKIAFAIVSIMLSLLVIRMWHLQVIRGDELTQRSENNSVRLRKIKPLRGLIMDTNGHVMVDNQPSFDIVFVPNRARNIQDVASKLKNLLAARDMALSMDIPSLGKKRWFPSVKLEKNISMEKLAIVEIHATDLPGVTVEVVPIRKYLGGEMKPTLLATPVKSVKKN
jgi:hypothetical protein